MECEYLKKLVEIGSAPLGPEIGSDNRIDFGVEDGLFDELFELLRLKNGFYAFESALHVFPLTSTPDVMNLKDWNDQRLWKHDYKSLTKNIIFFAEDAFGDQFCFAGGRVCKFDAETAELTDLGRTMADWAKAILDDYEFMTGYPLLREWQAANGKLAADSRLMTKLPFIVGGEYALDNLYALSGVKVMQNKGNIAVQIRDVPDGGKVRFKIIE